MQGYQGVLCGSCEESYGHLPGGQCVECKSGTSTIAWMVLSFILLVISISFQVVPAISASKNCLGLAAERAHNNGTVVPDKHSKLTVRQVYVLGALQRQTLMQFSFGAQNRARLSNVMPMKTTIILKGLRDSWRYARQTFRSKVVFFCLSFCSCLCILLFCALVLRNEQTV